MRESERGDEVAAYGAASRSSDFASVKWNGVGLAGRQVALVVFSIALARIVGPASYGVVAQATAYIAFTSLLLDQGISSSLIARLRVDRDLLGAAVTLNLILALAIALVTVPLAGPFAGFLNTPSLASVLVVLGAALVFKAGQVVPRMMLMRSFQFKKLALAEVGSAIAGGVIGVCYALNGGNHWAIVAQIIGTDVLLAIALVILARSPAPGHKLSRLGEIIGFSSRVMLGNVLSFGTRNVDTILVAKFLGSTQVGYYSLAYRILLLPVQMVGQTVTRVIFPIISRDREQSERVARVLLRCAGGIAAITFPVMGVVAISAHDAVRVVMGAEWLPAAPIVAVLALTGARQSITVLNAPVTLGFGRADLQLKFTVLAAVLQIGGMVAGLPWDAFGVAVGYTVGGLLMMPVVIEIERRLAGPSARQQLGVLLAPVHGSIWAVCVYAVLYLTPLDPWARLGIGCLLAGLTYLLVLRVFHRNVLARLVSDARSLAGVAA